ncbi:hypothetical protein GCM10008014_24230 [Paenibacillus silvae]|uniref:Uncharacterized protein n=1 Tax=Paenibacillus silvae TaxID=1325358 RepID=A0ABQ1ZAB5_9BACL|nr:hypothetical protein GCM10008014_24230 [Paenibacillus silvae]
MNGHSACGNLEADEEIQKYIKTKMTTTKKKRKKAKKKRIKRKRIITGGFCEYDESF